MEVVQEVVANLYVTPDVVKFILGSNFTIICCCV